MVSWKLSNRHEDYFGWASNPWDVHGWEECQQTQREKQTAGSSDNILEDHALKKRGRQQHPVGRLIFLYQ